MVPMDGRATLVRRICIIVEAVKQLKVKRRAKLTATTTTARH